MELLFFNCIISSMFSMTCSLVAFSLFVNSMKKPSSCCLSLLAHRIINAWHNSGPDLQSAPTPWMLDASLPLEALNCFWLALSAWFLVLAWFSCLCGGGVCLQRLLLFMYMCNWPLTAEVPVHCEVCVTLWSFYCLYKTTTGLIVQYCSPPRVAQTLLIFSTQIYFKSTYGVSRTGQVDFFFLLLFSSYFSSMALNINYYFYFFFSLCFSFPILLPLVSVTPFSRADSRESAVEWSIRKKPLFDNVCLSLR